MVSHDDGVIIKHRVEGHQITSVYTSQLPLVRAPIKAEGREFVFYGFGAPVPQVVDYQNIAGHLLESDLRDLESCFTWEFKNLKVDGLINATQRFAESEINIFLTEQALETKDANQPENNAAEKLLRAVDITYKDRATAALGRALEKLYRRQAIPQILAMSVCLLLGSCLLYYINWTIFRGPVLSAAFPVSIAILVTGTLLGFILDSVAMAKIKKTLPNLKPDQIETVLRKGGALRRVNIVAAALLVTVVVGFLGAAKWIDLQRSPSVVTADPANSSPPVKSRAKKH